MRRSDMVDMGSKGRLEEALRELLEAAGCYYLREGDGPGAEVWFTPHLNREFIMPHPVADPEAADAVLFQAGLELAFQKSGRRAAGRDGLSGKDRL